jgi:hypothetical protein
VQVRPEIFAVTCALCRDNDRYPDTAAHRGACRCPKSSARLTCSFGGECGGLWISP